MSSRVKESKRSFYPSLPLYQALVSVDMAGNISRQTETSCFINTSLNPVARSLLGWLFIAGVSLRTGQRRQEKTAHRWGSKEERTNRTWKKRAGAVSGDRSL